MNTLRVTLATDGSFDADQAEANFQRLPFEGNIELTVVSVVPIRSPGHVAFPGARNATWEATRIGRDIAERTLATISARLQHNGYATSTRILTGDPATEILQLLADEPCDLVVAGHGAVRDHGMLPLGGVARTLMLYSGTSVFIGRPMAEHDLRVLVATEGSDGSDMAVESLERVKPGRFGGTYPLCAVPHAVTENPALAAEAASECDRIAGSAATRLAHTSDDVRPMTGVGRPSDVITRHAKTLGVDLVVVGANRFSQLKRPFVGSCAFETAERVPCSVLVLRNALHMN